MTKKEKEIRAKIRKLKKFVEEGDNEQVHWIYDEIIYEIAKQYEPELVEKVDKISEGIIFWYA